MGYVLTLSLEGRELSVISWKSTFCALIVGLGTVACGTEDSETTQTRIASVVAAAPAAGVRMIDIQVPKPLSVAMPVLVPRQ
jgi:hypothetical protein